MAATNWKKIKAEYIAGGISYRVLAEKYGLKHDALRKRGEREKWGQERANAKERVSQEIAEQIKKTATKKAEIIVDELEVARYTALVFQDALNSLATMLEMNPESQNLRNVESLANAINKNVDSLMKTCRLLSVAEERKLEIEERKLKLEEEKFRAAQEAKENGMGEQIQVVLDDELEEYSQ